jgi:hypothetical protein
MASFDNSFLHSLRQNAEIMGADGVIAMDDFTIPKSISGSTFTVRTIHLTLTLTLALILARTLTLALTLTLTLTLTLIITLTQAQTG